MYDIEKMKHGRIVTVGEVIEALSTFSKDAEFLLDECDNIYIHCSIDGDNVNMSTEPLDSEYDVNQFDDDYDFYDKDLYDRLTKVNFGGSLYNDMIEVKTINESGKEVIRLIKEEDYSNKSLESLSVYHSYLKCDPDFNADRDQVEITGNKFSYFKGWYKDNSIEE